MKPTTFMLIAGEASGDTLAAELVEALRGRVLEWASQPTDDSQPLRTPLSPVFFGAGGSKMAAAGVELAFDLTRHSAIGFSDVLKHALTFRRLFHALVRLAIERQPDVIIGVDYGGFNLRFAKAVKSFVRRHRTEFTPWDPKLVQFVSPQVWASRPWRARRMETTHDLLLSIFPFEKEWYARHAPRLHVEYVGHPMMGRSQRTEGRGQKSVGGPCVVLLPGSRWDEVRRHLLMLRDTVHAMVASRAIDAPIRFKMVLPTQEMADYASDFEWPENTKVQVEDLVGALSQADLAITKSGTITMECAFFGVPAVVFYRTSWPTYWIAKQVVNVKHLAMPNLLAGDEVFPEFVQAAATPENLARAALQLLRDDARRQAVQAKLAHVVATLGLPGAPQRAAEAIIRLLP